MSWALFGLGLVAGLVLFLIGGFCGALLGAGANKPDPFNPRSLYPDKPGGEM